MRVRTIGTLASVALVVWKPILWLLDQIGRAQTAGDVMAAARGWRGVVEQLNSIPWGIPAAVGALFLALDFAFRHDLVRGEWKRRTESRKPLASATVEQKLRRRLKKVCYEGARAEIFL